MSETARENLRQAKDLFLMLWYHGTFPLSFVTYAVAVAMVVGALVGRFM